MHKNNKMNSLLIVIFSVFYILFIAALCYYYYLKKTEQFKDFFTCTLQLDNIDHRFIDEYKQYDNKSVGCGICKRATLKVNVTPCPKDAYGSPLTSCIQKATLTSSFGNPIEYTKDITPKNISDFFCFG